VPDSSLCAPMSLEDFAIAQEQLARAIKYAQEAKERPMEATEARAGLRYFFAYKLAMVRPRLDWDEQSLTWVTKWDCGSLEAAMYLMLLLDIKGTGMILTCPKCKTTFLGDHPRTQYCSPNCQNSAKDRKSVV